MRAVPAMQVMCRSLQLPCTSHQSFHLVDVSTAAQLRSAPPRGSHIFSWHAGGVSQPAVAMHPHQAAAQQWHHSNSARHRAAISHMNGHGGWGAPQNGGMHGGGPRFVWHEGQALQMPSPGGWDASNHPLSECSSHEAYAGVPCSAGFPVNLNPHFTCSVLVLEG